MKPDKGNGVVILDRKVYDSSIQKIIPDTSKFEMFDENHTLKREVSLQRFLHNLKQKSFFNENEYNKLYPSGVAPACMAPLKCTNFSLVIHFHKFV